MYAVVDVAGSQIKVEEGDRIRVSRLGAEAGAKLTFDRVLIVGGNGEPRVGAPQVEGASVEASVLGHGRAKKVVIFKMKRRKGYRRKNGHRQPYTEIQIDKISAQSSPSIEQPSIQPAGETSPSAGDGNGQGDNHGT